MNTIKIRNNIHKNWNLSRLNEEKQYSNVMYNDIIVLYLSRTLLVSEGVQLKKKYFKHIYFSLCPFPVCLGVLFIKWQKIKLNIMRRKYLIKYKI